MAEPSFSERDLQKLSLLRLRDLHNDLAKEKTGAKSAAKTWLYPLLLGGIAGCFASMCLSTVVAYLINPGIASGTAEAQPAELITAFSAFFSVLALTFILLRRWRKKKYDLAINSREAALASAVQEITSQQPGWTAEVGGFAALLDARRVEALLSLIDGGQKTTAAPAGALRSGALMGNQQPAGQIKPFAAAGGQVAAHSASKQTKCSKCGSKIDHFGFSQSDGMQVLAMRGQPSENERRHALMRSVGGTCPNCGKVYCSKCYYDQKYTCPNCTSKIPELGGK